MIVMLFTAVACTDPYDDFEETPGGSLDLDTDPGAVTTPRDPEDDAYINATPANDEKGWGELTPRQ